jgi:FAD/FMN-containing dehydrogenase
MPTRRAFIRSAVGLGVLGLAGRGLAQPQISGFRGEILTPPSPGYERARRMFVENPRRAARPRIIAVCADEDDVRRAIDFARERSLELAVRAGGHDMLAASTCDGLVIDLSALRSVAVDAAARTVRVGAGVRAGRLNAALAERGLAAVLGCDARVGVAGLTLGGGLGWLAGRHGAACDHLSAARLVTADGRALRAGAEEHPELRWGLRGGGGNFGVVTELTLRVHRAPRVSSGVVALRGERIASFLARHREYLASAGDDVDLETFIFAPHGAPMIFIKACHSGDPARAARALAPLRRLGTWVADDLAPRPYTGVIDPTGPVLPLFRPAASPPQAGAVPGVHVGAASLAPIGDAAAEILADGISRAEGRWAVGIAHHVHGAAARASSRTSSMRRVDGLVTAYLVASWQRPEDAERQMAWVDATVAALAAHAAPTYVNYMTSDDPAEVRRAYGDAYLRLARIKRRYDPDNLFRRNRNIVPGSA